MEIKDLLKSPQLFVVYAITLLYTITFSLAAMIALSNDTASGYLAGIHQVVAKVEMNNLELSQVERNNSSG
ncbi:hypothetical protein ABF87_06370 [Nitrosomonas sp. JL21]|uniref:hypothetical protein n=1 Tax=Nitrosomonas sp. JL21 TaxID=153949 RepID=UPI001371D3B3|nr:hypothetical protein [Nitrosomonas sp. JL21]MBL8496821.1 hypothetical protein [Nitrosomonas sp.]MBL8498427.1 hypothetical protein [Nitrosomonas sp.]MCC7092010.1 hypothetical protein [Nitrosomonas sp.]MXS77594.1 hypothetical protein [Nitrosomonas sp. JL21]